MLILTPGQVAQIPRARSEVDCLLPFLFFFWHLVLFFVLDPRSSHTNYHR